jgi:SAM-dependent methyltransferase
MPDRPQDVVARGYDAGAERFAAWKAEIVGMSGPARARELLALLPERPCVLELGTGAGAEETRVLADHGRLIGVDISAEQVRRARERIPNAEFIHADLTEVDFGAASFDAVVSFYAFNHVPREDLGPLLGRIAVWLRPGGYLLSSFGASDNPGWRGKWLSGVETFFSGYDPEVTVGLVREAGLHVVRHELETIIEPEGEATFLWALAQKPH